MSNNTEPIKPVKNLIDFDLLTYYNTKLKTYLTTLLSKKQDTLDSTNIKTINGESILGSGDIKAGNPNANVEAVDTSDIIDDVISNENSNYELPIASDTTLGGVKIGSGLTIGSDGTLSTSGDGLDLPIASLGTLGGVKVGTYISTTKYSKIAINESTGEIGLNYGNGLTTSSGSLTLNVGYGLEFDNDGKLCASSSNGSGSNYTLPIAGTTVLGGVIVGTTFSTGMSYAKLGINYSTGEIGINYGKGLTTDGLGLKLNIGTGANYYGISVNNSGYICVDAGEGLAVNEDKGIYINYGDGLDINSNGQLYATSNKQIINTEEDNITLTNNNYYKKINTSSEITINLEPVENNIVTNYCIEFTTADTGTTITLPNTIKWLNGNIPVFENGFTYQISIVNNLGIFAKYA